MLYACLRSSANHLISLLIRKVGRVVPTSGLLRDSVKNHVTIKHGLYHKVSLLGYLGLGHYAIVTWVEPIGIVALANI